MGGLGYLGSSATSPQSMTVNDLKPLLYYVLQRIYMAVDSASTLSCRRSDDSSNALLHRSHATTRPTLSVQLKTVPNETRVRTTAYIRQVGLAKVHSLCQRRNSYLR